MIAITQVEVDGMKFQLIPLPLLKVLKLDKQLLTLLLPALSGFKNLDAEVDLEAITKGISEALTRMPNEDFESFVTDLLSCATYLPSNSPPVQMTSTDQVNTIFSGKILSVYKLLFQVMKHNKFSPFALMEGGGDLKGLISGLLKPGDSRKENGDKSGNSAS